jgi:hypothetical protein
VDCRDVFRHDTPVRPRLSSLYPLSVTNGQLSRILRLGDVQIALNQLVSSASIFPCASSRALADDHTQGRARNHPGADAEVARTPVVAVLGEALAHHLAEASLGPRLDIVGGEARNGSPHPAEDDHHLRHRHQPGTAREREPLQGRGRGSGQAGRPRAAPPVEVPAFIQTLRTRNSKAITKLAFEWLIVTVTRPGEAGRTGPRLTSRRRLGRSQGLE